MTGPSEQGNHGGVQEHSSSGFGEISLRDRLEILDELARYSWAFDRGDMDEYLKRFHADAVFKHPKLDGSPGEYQGTEAIRAQFGGNFASRPDQTYGHQHQFNAVVMEPSGSDIRLSAYICIYRHEFHRLYWPHGPSWRMGTWHAIYGRARVGWRLREVDVQMWRDTAFSMGTNVSWEPGLPGVR